MASGPSGVGWSNLIDLLNDLFGDDTKRKQFADTFKQKHGNKGDGEPGTDKTPYKFGQFVDKHGSLLTGDNARAQFLIDSGRRHWDPSIELLEQAIKQSLTRVSASGAADPKKIKFISSTEASASTARAEITTSTATQPLTSPEDIARAIASADALTIKVVCPPGNLRPRP